jgi:hypothetical protein
MSRDKRMAVGFWTVTALFCVQMGFTAYAQLFLPQVADAFTHLGFPDYFRVEVSWAKLVGIAVLLAPVPARVKEWAYAGFAIDLGSAIVAHLAVGDGVAAWGWAAATGVLWGLSYLLWRSAQRFQVASHRLSVDVNGSGSTSPVARSINTTRRSPLYWYNAQATSHLPSGDQSS